MEYIDAKWHYPKMGEYPIKYGKYMQQNYPQIPCLVLYNGMYGVRFWNCTEECWDSEEVEARGSNGKHFLHQIFSKKQLFQTKNALCKHYIKMFEKFMDKGEDEK